MDLKIFFGEKIEVSSSTTLVYIIFKSYGGIILKILIQKMFPYICFTFWVCLHLHLQFLTEWYILSWRFQQQSYSARWDLSFDLHIWGGPGCVYNFTFSKSGEGVIKKLTSDLYSGAQITLGTIEKGQKFDYD